MVERAGWRYLKGHGTQNDFVLIPDLDGTVELDERLVRRLCDRREGLGADGVLRVVPLALAGDLAGPRTGGPGETGADTGPDADADADEPTWFMDHRNADGSLAEMCGNGVRLYARYLVDAGLAEPGTLHLATRGGTKTVQVTQDGAVTVDMGRAVVGEPLEVDGLPATAVDMGNPHAVVHVADVEALGELHPDRLDLNVEYVADVGPYHLAMRVHERGVGETRSCGTGACAAVVATSLREATPRGTPHLVDVPGGRLEVTWREDGHVTLTGPAVIVSEGVLRAAWIDA